MSIAKVVCIAVLGSILFASAAIAQPDRSGQPPAKAAHQSHKKQTHAKHRKQLRNHHLKRLLKHYHRHANRHAKFQLHAAPRTNPH